ncbi:eukaryotic translation initiation factor 3 subunit G isoform X2 [Triticum aestivum]|uniref:eukaryotic translation initiation factor 3 subunit G isoform X2 n=1 Tax=Triticum aestivum TaxID=4565 RepID=UPI001D00DE5B|nr:eukaryotic translation initiation factor 3 subunit G-like isoform X2 [Triticum aestivum]
MASRRQRRKIGEKKKRRKTRAATIKKKIVKKSSAPAPQAIEPKPSAARTGCRNGRQEGTAPAKEQDDKKHERRRREKRTCDLCGVGRIHENDHFCPYNYIHGPFSLGTCRERCPPGRHPLLLASASGSGSQHQLRRLVRVTNVPLSVIPGEHELRGLFTRFGPLLMGDLTSSRSHDPVGFGWVAFESREHAEEAINKLNGHLVGDRRLRVDWVYPR